MNIQPARVIDYSTMIRQWLFNQPARVIDYSTMIESQWLFASSRDWWFDNDRVTLIIHSSSHSSSINQLAWLIILSIDYSTMIRQWLFNQPARVIDYSTMIESLIIRQLAWLMIWQWLRHIDYSPARVIDYLTMIESHWLFVRVVIRAQSTNHVLV